MFNRHKAGGCKQCKKWRSLLSELFESTQWVPWEIVDKFGDNSARWKLMNKIRRELGGECKHCHHRCPAGDFHCCECGQHDATPRWKSGDEVPCAVHSKELGE
jgi:hypothetical protein